MNELWRHDERKTIKERDSTMIQYLSFEICQPTNESRYLKLFWKQDGFYLETASGYRGMYVVGNSRLYRCNQDSVESISRAIEPLKIYGWPKVVPFNYVPGIHIMGCDTDSWSIDYKEFEKKTMRHIRGNGAFPSAEPYRIFIDRLAEVIPDGLTKWLLQSD